MLRKLKPGQPGTKRLLEQYGAQLICVRYRYDAVARKRVKTVEIVIEENEWQPPPPPLKAEDIVLLHTGFVGPVQEQQLRAAGGRWDSKRCLWLIRYEAAVNLGLSAHVERREVSL